MDLPRGLRPIVATMSAVVALCSLAATTVYGVDITMCGQSVASGEVGVLTTDLACPLTAAAVSLYSAKLDMRGHTITGGNPALYCPSHCAILSSGGTPGTITGVSFGVDAGGGSAISNVRFMNPGPAPSVAIVGDGYTPVRPRVTLSDIVISGFTNAVVGESDIVGRNVEIDDCVGGLLSIRQESNTHRGSRIRIDQLIAMDDGPQEVVTASSVHLSNSNVTGALGIGLSAGSVSLRTSMVVDSQGVGIEASQVLLRDSSVTNNDQSGAGIDIESFAKPRLANSTCGLSQVLYGTGTWGVCTND